jgi:hypothetical protein
MTGSRAHDFATDGFVVVRKVFSAEEIDEMRRQVQRQVEADRAEGRFEDSFFRYMGVKSGKGDLLSKIHLRGILLDERILEIARSLLPPKPLVYFGESTYQLGSSGRYFHRDNVDRSKAEGPDWRGEYTLLRLGIYLQDHRRHSGGLKVRNGSHLHDGGRPCLVDSEVGDVVVWNMRTLHSGNAVRLRFWPSFAGIEPIGRLRRARDRRGYDSGMDAASFGARTGRPVHVFRRRIRAFGPLHLGIPGRVRGAERVDHYGTFRCGGLGNPATKAADGLPPAPGTRIKLASFVK